MKKKLVVLTNTCYPIASAVGNISIQYMEYLKEKFEIVCICVQDRDYSLYNKEIDGIKYFSITNWRYRIVEVLKYKRKDFHGFKKNVVDILCNILRLLGAIERRFFVLDGRWWYKRKALNILTELNKDNSITHIFSFSSPIGAHLAAYDFKIDHNQVKWISYWGDLFSENNFCQNLFLSKENIQNLEKKMIDSCDAVFTTEEILFHYRKLINEKSIIKSIPYTLNESILALSHKKNNKRKNNKVVICVCIGSLNKDIRNPEYMLRIFSILPDNYYLNLYTNGCEDIVVKYEKMTDGRIKKMNKVSFNELIYILLEADVLINISNSVSNSIPSKVLELISYRKMIIDFSKDNQSTNALSLYPLALCINESIDEKNSKEKILCFVNDNYSKLVDEEKIRSIYANNLEKTVKEIVVNTLEVE